MFRYFHLDVSALVGFASAELFDSYFDMFNRNKIKTVKDINGINFVNINCSLGVRYDNGSFDYFNSKPELPHNIINKFN